MATFTKHELSKARHNLNYAFKHYVKHKFDGRILLEAWGRLLDASHAIGCHPETKPYQKPEYWEDPDTYSNESNNPNPILEITDEFKVIHRRDMDNSGKIKPKKSTAKGTKGSPKCDINAAHGASQCDIINTKNAEEMSPRQTIIEREPKLPVQPYYYKVNISWVERENTPMEVINEVLDYVKTTGLELVKIHDFNNGYEIEKTAEYKMQGTKDAFEWVRRCIVAYLIKFVGGIPSFNIAISGKKYEDFEIDKNI